MRKIDENHYFLVLVGKEASGMPQGEIVDCTFGTLEEMRAKARARMDMEKYRDIYICKTLEYV